MDSVVKLIFGDEMEKITDYEMEIRRTKKAHVKCGVCGYAYNETYIFRRHKKSEYLCRKCISDLLFLAALQN